MKSPRLYFRDSGLLHLELGVKTSEELLVSARVGASWEGFVLEQVIALSLASSEEVFFWRTQNGAELDLLLIRGARRVGFEIKRSSAPGFTPSMKSALADLRLDALYAVHAGEHDYTIGPRTRAIPWAPPHHLGQRAEPEGSSSSVRSARLEAGEEVVLRWAKCHFSITSCAPSSSPR